MLNSGPQAVSRADMMSFTVPEISGSCERRVTAGVLPARDRCHVTETVAE